MSALISWRNLVDEADSVTMPEGSQSGFGPAQLQLQQLAEVARTVDDNAARTFRAEWATLGAQNIGLIALLGHNVSAAATVAVDLFPTAGGGATSVSTTAFHESTQLPSTMPRNFYWVVSPAISAEAVEVTITDTTNPDGFIQAGRLWAGPALSFSMGFGKSHGGDFEDDGQSPESRGGQAYGDDGDDEVGVRRSLKVQVNHVPNDLVFGSAADDLCLFRAWMESGRRRHLIALPRTDLTQNMHRQAVYGTFRGRPQWDRRPGDFYKIGFEVKEQR